MLSKFCILPLLQYTYIDHLILSFVRVLIREKKKRENFVIKFQMILSNKLDRKTAVQLFALIYMNTNNNK